MLKAAAMFCLLHPTHETAALSCPVKVFREQNVNEATE
jgi:hypothetical protein